MARYAKFFVAALTACGVIVSANVLPAGWQDWAVALVSAAGAALVYLVPNAPVPFYSSPLVGGSQPQGDAHRR